MFLVFLLCLVIDFFIGIGEVWLGVNVDDFEGVVVGVVSFCIIGFFVRRFEWLYFYDCYMCYYINIL